jgi:hypothetical protein
MNKPSLAIALYISLTSMLVHLGTCLQFPDVCWSAAPTFVLTQFVCLLGILLDTTGIAGEFRAWIGMVSILSYVGQLSFYLMFSFSVLS